MSETTDPGVAWAWFAAYLVACVLVCTLLAAIPAARGLSELYDRLIDEWE